MALTPTIGGSITAFDYAHYAFLTGEQSVTELILVRHGQQLHFPAATAFEDNVDPPLSPVGQLQADAVGRRFAEQPIDAVYSSTLTRAVHTGREIARHHAIEPVQLSDLREVQIFRDLPKGMTVEEYLGHTIMLGVRERMMFEKRWDVYPGSERSVDFRNRVVTLIEGIAASHEGQHVVIACHGGVINAYLAHHLGIEPDMFFRPAHTSVNVVLAARHGVRALRTLGDVHHLDGRPELVTY